MIHRDQVLLQLIRFAEAVHDALVNRPDIGDHHRHDINLQYVQLVMMGDTIKSNVDKPKDEPEFESKNLALVCPICGARAQLSNGRSTDYRTVPKHLRAAKAETPFDFVETMADACPGSGQVVRVSVI